MIRNLPILRDLINQKTFQLALLERMLLIRQEEIANQYPKQKMRYPTHLSIGQEAIGCNQLV